MLHKQNRKKVLHQSENNLYIETTSKTLFKTQGIRSTQLKTQEEKGGFKLKWVEIESLMACHAQKQKNKFSTKLEEDSKRFNNTSRYD